MDIADRESWGNRDLVLYWFRPFRHHRHPLSGCVEIFAEAVGQHAPCGMVLFQGQAKGCGNTLARDVVMRRADTARREDVIVGGTQFVNRLDDPLRYIGNDPNLL